MFIDADENLGVGVGGGGYAPLREDVVEGLRELGQIRERFSPDLHGKSWLFEKKIVSEHIFVYSALKCTWAKLEKVLKM